MLQPRLLVPQNATAFGDRVFEEGNIKVNELIRVGLKKKFG